MMWMVSLHLIKLQDGQNKNETVTYTLKVKDSSGNEGKKDITVQYIVPTTENTTPSDE